MKQELKEAKINSTRDGSKISDILVVKKKVQIADQEKKEDHKNHKWNKARKDKSGRKLWELISREKCRRERISEKNGGVDTLFQSTDEQCGERERRWRSKD